MEFWKQMIIFPILPIKWWDCYDLFHFLQWEEAQYWAIMLIKINYHFLNPSIFDGDDEYISLYFFRLENWSNDLNSIFHHKWSMHTWNHGSPILDRCREPAY